MARGKQLTIAQKQEIGAGNVDPIDEVRDEKAMAREREVKAVEERRKIAEKKQREDQEFYEKMVAPRNKNSSNGHGKQSSPF